MPPNTAINFIIINRQYVNKNKKIFPLANLKISNLTTGFQRMYYLTQTKKSSYMNHKKT